MEELAKEIERRGSNPYHVFFASLLASLGQRRLLSYMSVSGVTREVGERMAFIYGRESTPVASIRKAASLLQVGEFEVLEKPGLAVFKAKFSTCRICPRGVGGYTLPEKLCPLVGFLAGFAGLNYRLENHKREGDYCFIEYPVTA